MKTNDIRQSFLEFFKKRDHRIEESSKVFPENDPTILFTNAGMNQFKDVFTGQRRVDYVRAATVQKCIRAGGKHNDLDNVGFTARHHTFFEMLGNFSFGDYFKEQAILYAWEWITKELKLSKDRLYATVFETDDEAFDLWCKIAPELKKGRILRFGKKDNFWSMGDIGPCGPCSEIHYDRGERFGTGPDNVVNGEGDRFIEIWNLVFMQYNQAPGEPLKPLPKPSVDTGAGLERFSCVLMDADSNYGIDIFQALIRAISELAHSKYEDNIPSHHVIADHIRALTFAIADGAGISNEGRGYVLRRILRRAAFHAKQLGAEEPILYRLVPVLAEEMGSAYPVIRERQVHVSTTIRGEEESFARTLENGLRMFRRSAKDLIDTGVGVVPGRDVFELQDTYGFPYDLTEIVAREFKLKLDRQGYEQALAEQRARSRMDTSFKNQNTAHYFSFSDETEESSSPTGYDPWHPSLSKRTIVQDFRQGGGSGDSYSIDVILAESPFYVEAGGQVSDSGVISSADSAFEVRVIGAQWNKERVVLNTLADADAYPNISKGCEVIAHVDIPRRWDIMRNHTATHLMHAALRKVLGHHVHQSGSYVGPDRLRFDFSHHQPLTQDEVRTIESMVNEQILMGTEVVTQTDMTVDEAKKSGAMALFGEKYGDTVRVVSVGDFSKELCGGTHVENTSQIGPFFITLETGVASGVRRIEAITGREAQAFMLDAKQFRRQAAHLIGRPENEALVGLEQLREEHSSLQKELKKTKQEMFSGGAKTVGEESPIGPLTLIAHDFGATDKDTIAAWLDTHKAKNKPLVVVGLGQVNGKVMYLAAASSPAVENHKIDVGELSRVLLSEFGGKGGGKASFAQGGVAPETKSAKLFDRMKALLAEKVK